MGRGARETLRIAVEKARHEERARIVEFIRSTPDHTTRILHRIADEIEAGLHEEMAGPLQGRVERVQAAALARKAGQP